MYDKLYDLAKKIDSINYEYDTYDYMDTLDMDYSIGEARTNRIDNIYNYILQGEIINYINWLNNIMEYTEGELLKQVQEVLKELKELEEV